MLKELAARAFKMAYLIDDLGSKFDSWGHNLRLRILRKSAENPAKYVRTVAEARTNETLKSLYAYALEFCIENEIRQCWSHVFRLDEFKTNAGQAAALRAFCIRWLSPTESGMVRAQQIENTLDLLFRSNPVARLERMASASVEFLATVRRRGITPYDLGDWRELIRALYVLNFYETTGYGRKNFSAIHRIARQLFESVPEPAGNVTPHQRDVLVRYAINFDLLDIALRFAINGGKSGEFVTRLLRDFDRLTKVNSKFCAEYRADAHKPSISIVASTVWGDQFVDNFMNYCVASLLSNGNIPDLAKETSVIHSIVTTRRDEARVRAHPLFRELERQARVEFRIFDDSLLQEREDSGFAFYRFYGLLDHVHIDLARKLSCDLYLLPPDVVYSADCLTVLRRSLVDQGDVCQPPYLEAERSGFLRDINGLRSSNAVLSLPGRELLVCAAKNITDHFRSLIVSRQNNQFCRDPREIFWPVENGLMMHSVYIHPCAVSRRVLARGFHPNYENVDYAFPARVLQADGKLSVLNNADLAAAVHFSPTKRAGAYTKTGFRLRDFVGAHAHDYHVHRECFPNGVFLPCGDLGYPAAAGYREELAIVVAALERPVNTSGYNPFFPPRRYNG